MAIWLQRAGRCVLSMLWRCLVAYGMYTTCLAIRPSSSPHAEPPWPSHRAHGLDAPSGRHPERLVPYEFLTADDRRTWAEFETRVR